MTSIVIGCSVATKGKASSSAVRNWLDTSPRTLTAWFSASFDGPFRRSGGKPSWPRQSILQPSRRKASTRSPIGRSCIRGTPLSVNSPPCVAASKASAAVNGRIAVPALPRNSRASASPFNWPPIPVTRSTPSVVFCNWQPSLRKASSITAVSSESSRSWTVVTPSDRPASSNTRLEMLFEPGSTTVPAAERSGGKSRKGSLYMVLTGDRISAAVAIQPAAIDCARWIFDECVPRCPAHRR